MAWPNWTIWDFEILLGGHLRQEGCGRQLAAPFIAFGWQFLR